MFSIFILKHWRGEFSLARSFWGNFLGIFILVFFLGSIGFGLLIQAMPHLTEGVWFLFPLLFWLVMYPWQVVGVWRSADKNKEKTGTAFFGFLAKFFVISLGLGLIMRLFGFT